MKTKSIIILFSSLLLWFIACSDSDNINPLSNESSEVQSLENIPTLECLHGRILFRGEPAAQIIYADPYTYYECILYETHIAIGGEVIHVDRWVKNTAGYTYTLQLNEGYLYELSEPTEVEITDPVNVEYLNETGEWVSISMNTIVVTEKVWVNEGGSALMTTSGTTTPTEGGGSENE